MDPMVVQLIMILGLFAIMYFFLIRPQKKKEKQVAEMRNSVKAGDDILTIGGIYAKVVKVKDDVITVQIGADKVKFDIAKWAISKIETAAPTSKKRIAEDDFEEKPAKVSPKKLKKLAQAEPSQVEDAPVQEEAADNSDESAE